VLTLAERVHYPLISSHNGTGGAWTPAQLRRLYALGGFVAVNADTAPRLARAIARLLGRFRGGGRAAVGLGTDTGGFSTLPGPRPDAARDPHAIRSPRATAG